MAIPVPLQASARSAYRSIFRAANTTFAGDPQILRAFIQKTRQDFISGKSETNETAYAERVKLANEIAEVLRKNIVQGQLQEDGVYSLRITKNTELGSNETIKNPTPYERPSRARLRAQKTEASSASHPDSMLNDNIPIEKNPPLNMNYSTLKKASLKRKVPQLNEDDLEETFIRGGGPGGQAINKTANNVSLLHKPTGIRVQCQETRSLQDNRRIARKILLSKIDALENPGLSKRDLEFAKEKERKRRKAKKTRKKENSSPT